MCAAIKAENRIVKRELEGLWKEIRSTYLSKTILHDIKKTVGTSRCVPDYLDKTAFLQIEDDITMEKEQQDATQPAMSNQPCVKAQDPKKSLAKTFQYALPTHLGH